MPRRQRLISRKSRLVFFLSFVSFVSFVVNAFGLPLH